MGAHHRLLVLVAQGDGTGPDVTSAMQSLQLGRRTAVGSVYIAPTESYRRQLELAILESGALAVSAPIGPDPLLSELAMGRYAFAAMELLDDECEVDVDRSSKAQ